MTRFLTASLIVLLTLSACSKSSDSQEPPIDPDVETSITAKAAPALMGLYTSPDASLAINADLSYNLRIRQEIGLYAKKDRATRQFYAFCTIEEKGQFDLFAKHGFNHLRTKAADVKAIKAEPAQRGPKVDPNEVCNRYVEARKNQVLVQQYEVPSAGAFMLKDFQRLEYGTFEGDPTSFNQVTGTPYAVGVLMSSADGRRVDLTDAIGLYLGATNSPERNGMKIDFDLASRQVKATYAPCHFEVAFESQIAISGGEMSLRPVSEVKIQALEGAPVNPTHCQEQRDKFLSAEFADQGFALRFSSWYHLELTWDYHLVEKEIREDVADNGVDTINQ